jgi:hypothetical protein
MSGDSKRHKSDSKFLKKHVETGSVEGGACLNRHRSDVAAKSCSHRWQAFKKAEENAQWYDYPAYKALVWKPGSTPIQTAQWGHFLDILWRPLQGSWDLHSSSWGFPNFQCWSRAPYWHQAHHLIPNGVLNDCITERAKENRSLYFTVRSGLLGALYNLNHKDNVVILPMGKVVAAALGLPRHIAGIESEPGVKMATRDHPVYSKHVKKEVENVIRRYAREIDEKKHSEETDDIAKVELETISENIFIRLTSWRGSGIGLSLDSMPGDMLSGLC